MPGRPGRLGSVQKIWGQDKFCFCARCLRLLEGVAHTDGEDAALTTSLDAVVDTILQAHPEARKELLSTPPKYGNDTWGAFFATALKRREDIDWRGRVLSLV